jgi:hypothetical protein
VTDVEWRSYQALVLSKLEEHTQAMAASAELITMLRLDVARLEIRAGLWGMLAGAVPSAALLLSQWLS